MTLPRLAAQVPASRYTHTTRDDFEHLYDAVGAANYIWYQFRIQVEAAALYERAGSSAITRLFSAFDLDDAALARQLDASVDPGLADSSLTF